VRGGNPPSTDMSLSALVQSSQLTEKPEDEVWILKLPEWHLLLACFFGDGCNFSSALSVLTLNPTRTCEDLLFGQNWSYCPKLEALVSLRPVGVQKEMMWHTRQLYP
jgi:hypothetical protein